jgi:2'-5' RNA ligase
MPRLFTGLEIPPEVAATLSMLRGGLHGARWISPEFYHVTLRFIGDIDMDVARDIDEALAEVRRPPLTITIDGLASFGGDRPRAIIANVVSTPALIEMQAEQERIMRRLGLPPETRKFMPHVTLARLRDAQPHCVAQFLSTFGHFPKVSFTAAQFVLYSARASVGGGPYIVEAEYPLG